MKSSIQTMKTSLVEKFNEIIKSVGADSEVRTRFQNQLISIWTSFFYQMEGLVSCPPNPLLI